MSTKRKFAEQLRGMLYPSTTPDAKFDLQTAMTAVSQARDEYVKNIILQSKAETNIVYGNWISSFDNVEVKYDDVRCEYYSYLPSRVISLDSDRGVQRIFNPKAPQDEYIIVPRGFRAMMRNSLASGLEGNRGAFLAIDKVIYLQRETSDCKLSMDLIVESDDIDMYEEFPVDGSAIPMILSRAVELYSLQRQMPEDILNNSISD